MNLAEIAALLALNLGLTLSAMAGLWALSLRWKGIGFIDAVWPLALAAPAATTFLLAEGDPVRKGLLLWLVAIWAAPQAWRPRPRPRAPKWTRATRPWPRSSPPAGDGAPAGPG